jgi:RHS repeat-associated protein
LTLSDRTTFALYQPGLSAGSFIGLRTNQSNVSFDNLRITGSPASYNTLVYLHGDHLGSVGVVTSSGGALLDMTRFLPFGGYRGSEPAFLTERGFTGHKMNNTATNDLGLIYMNARYYVSYINRFVSADTIVPDPTNPQSFNRYSYVENRPLNFSDPTGHCGGDPNNNDPFDESGNIIYFDCTLENFDTMPIADRLRWIQLFMQQTGTDTAGWFNNIEGIIQAFVNHGLAESGSWLSIVDAAILQGIQDGYAGSGEAMEKGIIGNASSNSGRTHWTTFFDKFYSGAGRSELEALWGTAEMEATKYGERVAELRDEVPPPNGYESFFLTTGNAYRWATSHGGLGNYFMGATLAFPPAMVVAPHAKLFGDWFNSPLSVDPVKGMSPVYWYSSAIWEVQSWSSD